MKEKSPYLHRIQCGQRESDSSLKVGGNYRPRKGLFFFQSSQAMETSQSPMIAE